MLKKVLMVGALALLATGTARPAAAQNTPVFFEPYGELFSARTPLMSANDGRPKDVRQGQGSRVENPSQRLSVQGGVYDTSDIFLGGGGLSYSNNQWKNHPWSVSFFGNFFSVDGVDDNGAFLDFTGKLVLWQPSDKNWPVASVVVNYQDPDDVGDFFRVVLAIDQRITNEAFFTANVGWANVQAPGFDEDGLFSGVGLTWRPSRWPRLSLSANYNFDGNVAFEDTYSVSGTWLINRDTSIQVGGGKHDKIFGNLRWNWDWK
jgi:hypothetical protein